MEININKIDIKECLSGLQINLKEIPFDINWQAGKYFVLSSNLHKKGSFELFFGKVSKFKSIARMTLFGEDSNVLADRIGIPWKIGGRIPEDGVLNFNINKHKVSIVEANGVIKSIDIVDGECIRENNGFYKSMEKFNRIPEANNSSYIYDKLIGAWDRHEGDITRLGIWVRFVFYREDVLNMHIYRSNISNDFKNLKYSKYYNLCKVSEIEDEKTFVLKFLDVKFANIGKYRCKLDGDDLWIFEDDHMFIYKKIGPPDNFIA